LVGLIIIIAFAKIPFEPEYSHILSAMTNSSHDGSKIAQVQVRRFGKSHPLALNNGETVRVGGHKAAKGR